MPCRSHNSLFSLVPEPSDAGTRLDAFLSRRLPHLSRRRIRKLIADGQVYIDGAPAHKGTRLQGSEKIELPEAVASVTCLQPNPALPVLVLFEDPHVVAVNKPSGLATHALEPAEENTVANFLLAHYPEMATLSARGLEAGLVHRLDRETSGVLLAARTPFARAFLREEFRARRVRKAYWALVHSAVQRPGTVAARLRQDPRNRGKVRLVPAGASSREAVTHFRPIEHFPGFTLLWVEIETGAMHQIRAHLSGIGHPIVGDTLYGQSEPPLARQFLHATQVEFRHPHTGQRVTVEAPLPHELESFLEQLRKIRTHAGSAERPPS